jgi:hypothetical protein
MASRGIPYQVGEHLLDLDPIDKSNGSILIKIKLNRDAKNAGAGLCKGSCFLDHGAHAFASHLRFAPCHKFPQAPDDLPDTQRLFGCLLHDLAYGIGLIACPIRQETARGVHGIGNGGQRLVDFMRKGGGHLSGCAQAPGM